jgi:hypothetical protein
LHNLGDNISPGFFASWRVFSQKRWAAVSGDACQKLFPHSAAIGAKDRLVIADYVQALKAYRLTLSVPVLNNAAAVLFLVDRAAAANLREH